MFAATGLQSATLHIPQTTKIWTLLFSSHHPNITVLILPTNPIFSQQEWVFFLSSWSQFTEKCPCVRPAKSLRCNYEADGPAAVFLRSYCQPWYGVRGEYDEFRKCHIIVALSCQYEKTYIYIYISRHQEKREGRGAGRHYGEDGERNDGLIRKRKDMR